MLFLFILRKLWSDFYSDVYVFPHTELLSLWRKTIIRINIFCAILYFILFTVRKSRSKNTSRFSHIIAHWKSQSIPFSQVYLLSHECWLNLPYCVGVLEKMCLNKQSISDSSLSILQPLPDSDSILYGHYQLIVSKVVLYNSSCPNPAKCNTFLPCVLTFALTMGPSLVCVSHNTS